jgi:tetratricopeptide (TPR) repeat protein
MEFQIELQQLLADDRTLRVFTPDERKLLFTLWYGKGDKLWLAQTLQEHPEWKKIAWRQLARAYADYQDYRQAFETADQFLPQIDNAESSSASESPVELALRFRNNPTDPRVGEALALALAREGKIAGALSTLRAMRDLPGSSKYLPALEGRLWAKEQDWKRAWNAVAPLVSAQE